MARTAVELPDPLENPGGGAMNGADDLLAQLAGEEVDRLLSEADDGSPGAHNIDQAVTDHAVDDADLMANATEASLDDLFNKLDESEVPGGDPRPVAETLVLEPEPDDDEAAPVEVQSAEDVIAQRADELVARARQESGATEPAGEASAADALAAEMEADDVAHAAALRRMGQAPKALEPEPEAAEAPTDDAPSIVIDEEAVDLGAEQDELSEGRVPLLVRVLEWVNSPLAGLPLGVREAMGKVALITAVNAVAVFVYVLIFRRH